MRKVKLFIAASIDGYIARADGNLDWLSMVEQPGEDYGYEAFVKTIDTVIVGRKTYDKVLSMGVDFPHTDKKCYVITRTERPAVGNLVFYTGKLEMLVSQLKQEDGKDIFCDGGAEILTALFQHNLIDECILSVIPVLLGNGIRLFNDGRPETLWQLVTSRSFASGLVQLHYQLKR
jgi:dihydrofolate reductase